MSTRIRILVGVGVVIGTFAVARHSQAAPRTWIGGNADWNDGAGNNANWNPANEPGPGDDAIFNTPNSVNLGTSNSIAALTMSNGIDLNTNDFDLGVAGLVQLVDASTNLIIGGSASTLTADDVTINSGGQVQLNGGVLTVTDRNVLTTAVVTNNAGGALSGFGTVNLNDATLAVATLFNNNGTISAQRAPLLPLGAPQVGTLSINASSANTRIDLDGSGEAGVVNVFRNQSLNINVPLADIFNGDINLFQNSTLDISNSWTLGTGTIDVNNGATGIFPAIPAGVAFIGGGAFAQNGGTITVMDTDGTLQFDAVYTQNAGTLVNNGLVIFNAIANINTANNFTMPTTSSSITVNAAVTIGDATVNAGEDFNWDGGGAATNVTTVNAAGDLNINVENINTGSSDEHDGTITMNSGNIDVQVADNAWVMAGTLNINNTANDVPVLSGDAVQIGNDAGALDTHVNVGGTGVSQITAAITFKSDASVNIAAGATLRTTAVTFESVNGVNNAQFTGSGTWLLTGTNTVSEATTINMTGGTVDLDNSSVAALVANNTNINAPLTINAATLSDYGSSKIFLGNPTFSNLTIDNSAGTGTLTVNLDNPKSEWSVNSVGIVNLINDVNPATLLAGSDINLNGTVNVTGDVRTTARVDIGGTVNINTAGEPFRLGGGNTTTDPNTLAGGTITGVGILSADTGHSLHGFGTINTSVQFIGTANLKADNGMLTVNGTIADVNVLGTADTDGILNIPAAWNTATNIASVDMLGGEIRGGTITNDNALGITGFGLISARVLNNTRLNATHNGTLVVETAANNDDWDGAANTGQLIATAGVLEIRDNAQFLFNGGATVSTGSELFANGFELQFEPASTLALSQTGRFRSTNSTNFGGTMTVGAGTSPAELNVTGTFVFEAGSTTTITGILGVNNDVTEVQSGATFGGGGTLQNFAGKTLRLLGGANVGLLIQNKGALEIGASPAQATGLDFQQDLSGTIQVELQGTGLAQFDRFNLTGAALLDGGVNVSLLGGFVPALGNTFNFLSATAGVTGTFASLTQPAGMPAGLFFGLAYQPTFAQLVVIDHLPGDYNKNGVVDAADYTVWRDTLGQSVAALSGADGNGNGMVDDGDYSFWKMHFGQSAPGSGAGASANAVVPEPATIALAMIAAALLCGRPRAANKNIC